MQHPRLAPSRRAVVAGLTAAGLAASGARAQTLPVVGKIERLDPEVDALVDADAVVERVLGDYTWCEGPVWVGGPDGFILSSDVRANAIRRWNEKDGGSVWLTPSGYEGPPDPDINEPGSNGLCLGRGGVVFAGSGARVVGVIDLKTKKKTVLCSHFEGKKFNSPNDVVLAKDGSIYFTDPCFGLKGGVDSPLREMNYQGVFRIAPDNTVSLVDGDLSPNGIGLSPDGRTLYLTDKYNRDDKGRWFAMTLDEKGAVTDKREFIGMQHGPGDGDGLRVDTGGYVWATSADGVSIYTPQGKPIGIVRANEIERNCEIGADGYLYIAARHDLLRVKVKAKKLLWPVWRKA